jgi:preprotein translocase subunit SecA
MLEKVSKILLKVFGSRNERLIRAYSVIARQAGEFEEQIKKLDDEALKEKTSQFKASLETGSRPEDILPEAFAVVREAARRNVNMRHFDVQLIGGNVLYEGKIAEMVTGEGKTLVATLAAYLVHLTGRKVHIVTVNDYLAKRDAEWMGPIYRALGLTVGAIQADMDTSGEERKSQYRCDVTYGTNNEFGFDYLRDNMKISLEEMVQSPLQYAIIDEVDSILIDEARTPLIISGPAFDDVSRYRKADEVAKKLIGLQSNYDRIKRQIEAAELAIAGAQGEIAEAKKDKDDKRIEKAQKVIVQKQAEVENARQKLTGITQYYEVEYDKKSVHLTHEGVGAAQEIAGVGSFFTGSNMEWPHLLEQSLRAHVVFEREKDYVVMDGKVIIVDEFTGRLMHGRQWSDGLHQAVEAKEAVEVKEETQTLATITLQNFFKLYSQIAGMTGTAATEANEFMNIYKLDVVVIPTNEPCIRSDMDDVIYKSMPEKFNAITEEIDEISSSGRPVLVGTISIEKSEALSAVLSKRFGIEHEVLNAKHHAREAAIVAKAGQQHSGRDGRMRGNVTISTNMAGRGTDIVLGPGVAQLGGLHVLGTERHEARRIDNQLRGRSGRQGDAGSSQFFLSFDDELMQLFGGDRIPKLLSLVGWKENEPIFHPRISKQIAKIQRKVEERNFEIRKSLLEYDEVMDYQRKIFYSRRREILAGKRLKKIIEEMIDSANAKNCRTILSADYHIRCIIEWARVNFGVDLKPGDITDFSASEIEESIKSRAKDDVAGEISLTIGEYLEDYSDPQSWDINGLCKWAMSAFRVSLSPSKIKQQRPEEIEKQLISASAEQIDKKDCSRLAEFLKADFAIRTFVEWASAKFDIKLETSELAGLNAEQIGRLVRDRAAAKYKQKEIEYPVEFAMNIVYGPQGPNVYAFEALAEWAKKKYNAEISAEQIANTKPGSLHQQLLELSESFNNGQLERELDDKIGRLDIPELVRWANERFEVCLSESDVGRGVQCREKLREAGREFLRRELSDLEKYVLLQVYDSTWKDHLYSMDRLKDSIWTRSLAEKDPKVEYKREGFKMFNEMLETIEDRVTDIIFRVHLEAGARARSVWRVSQVAHDEVGQFAMAERQRAAAQAPQGEQKVKQIKLEQPKVGRNDPCPCGSGKKYKKCCGAEGNIKV